MGNKAAAKARMVAAGVPCIPGFAGEQDAGAFARAAREIGYPVMLKAAAGGGGKGMRVVEAPADFAEALALARGEASASFGDDRVLIEKYLTRPRHIELQVFADRHGNTVHLFERDCSIQRRHQKVVEEAPAPGMTAERRAEMGRAACDAARAIGYQGAGTVEFIVEQDDFFFMEMNTRLQVEHPVTEAITGQDLVEWQLRVAAGETLPLQQDELAIDGHAIEVRVYAEDPARDYRPSTGRLAHLRQPGPPSRVDTGVRQGDAITVHYDPMIAKLIVHGSTRDEAVARLRAALGQYKVGGVRTNLALLRAIASNPDFAAAALDTSFLARHPELLAGDTGAPSLLVLAAATEATLAARAQSAAAALGQRHDPHSPWGAASAWRLNGAGYQDLAFQSGDTLTPVRAFPHPGGLDIETEGRRIAVRRDGETLSIDGVRGRAPAAIEGLAVSVFIDGAAWSLALVDPLAPPASVGSGAERLLSPMPGRIVSLHTEPGASVTKGEVLIVLEAMKVQMRLAAPRDGVVASVRAQPGELVEEGVELVTFSDR
jgi:3-methylcrotonyl-CoA carboxylase alpha subunit